MRQTYIILISAAFLVLAVLLGHRLLPAPGSSAALQEYLQFRRRRFLAAYIPAFAQSMFTYWNASVSGRPEDWALAETASQRINLMLSNQSEFQVLRSALAEAKAALNETERRELEIVYNMYMGNQADPAMLNSITSLANSIERRFTTYRTTFRGRNLTDNEVREILANSTDSATLREVWTAQKSVAEVIAQDVVRLAKMRNQVAVALGFRSYHTMSLRLGEQDPEQISSLFDELDASTREPYILLKKEVDSYLAKRYGVEEQELMPWHYQDLFFQEAPKIYDADFDSYYKDRDIANLTVEFYRGLGLPIDDLLKNSNLYAKEGKNQHAFMMNMGGGDIRVLSNNVNNSMWMSTMLHEFGHAAYEKYIDGALPYLLREPAHIFTTEAVAMMFGRLATNPRWIARFSHIENVAALSKASKRNSALSRLVFSRWAQVMYRFERGMYEDPEQDLRELWWGLVEKYQMLRRPTGRTAADWAAKIHIAISPCYYHNYLLGDLLASQLNNYMCTRLMENESVVEPDYYGRAGIGTYLREKVFFPGKLYKWNEMIRRATGEELTSKYYAQEIAACLQ